MDKELETNLVEAITTLVQFNNKAFTTFDEFLNKAEEHAKKNGDSKLQKMVDDVEKKYETYNKEMEEKTSKLQKETTAGVAKEKDPLSNYSLKDNIRSKDLDPVKIPFNQVIPYITGKIMKVNPVASGLNFEILGNLYKLAEKYPIVNMAMQRDSHVLNPNDVLKDWEHLGKTMMMLILYPITSFIVKNHRVPNREELHELSYRLIIGVDYSILDSEVSGMLSKMYNLINEEILKEVIAKSK